MVTDKQWTPSDIHEDSNARSMLRTYLDPLGPNSADSNDPHQQEDMWNDPHQQEHNDDPSDEPMD